MNRTAPSFRLSGNRWQDFQQGLIHRSNASEIAKSDTSPQDRGRQTSQRHSKNNFLDSSPRISSGNCSPPLDRSPSKTPKSRWSRMNFRSKDKDKDQDKDMRGYFRTIDVTNNKLGRNGQKIDSHQLFQKTFEACQGYRYISYNISKHPKRKTLPSSSYQHHRIPVERAVKGSEGALVNHAKYKDERPSWKPSENIYFISSMFVGYKAREEFDNKARRSDINRLTLVNHAGKPIRYVLKRKSY